MSGLNRCEEALQALAAAKAAQKKALEALGRAPSALWETYPAELRAAAGSSAGAVQAERVVTPDPSGAVILPEAGYAAMGQVVLRGDPSFLPCNLRAGTQVWGITGTAAAKEG